MTSGNKASSIESGFTHGFTYLNLSQISGKEPQERTLPKEQ
jgi:hypothetical protein